MFPFFVIGIFILIQVPASLCVAEEYYQKCSSSYRCANINISYPFWGGGRPENCGYPGYELNCQGDAPQITSGTTNYNVLGIDSFSHTVKVRVDYWYTVCSQYLFNTTLDFNPSGYSSTVQHQLTLYYGCTAMVEPVPGFTTSNQFSCRINGTDSIGYYLIGNSTSTSAAVSCSDRVVVPISQTTAQTLATNLTATSGQSPNLTAALNGGFELQWAANNALCDQCANSGGQCGYKQTAPSAFICYCTKGSYVNTCRGTPFSAGSASTIQVPLTVGLAVGGAGVFGFIVAGIVVTCCRKRGTISSKTMVFWKKETKIDQNVEEFIRNHGSLTLKRYSYSDIRKMTKSFKEKLGQGGYGDVYKGKLCDDRLVAVKVLSESKGNGEEFINEVASISRTSHVNIVTLLGFSYERTRRALIYEFMANGSLDKFIYDKGSSNANRHLEWKTLYQIAIGIARGLEYLHRGCNTRILHFDIKPHNILLDEDFCPKISDFGLAKLCERKESVISMLGTRGTVGYIAPEVFCRNFGGVSHKSDVYSYGMMVLEMVGGRENIDPGVSRTSEIYFPHWIYEPLKLGKELKLHGITTQEEEEITRKMILVSLWCIQTNPSDRPSMTKVVEMLEGSLQSLQIPPKPFLSSPPRPPIHSSTTSLS